MSHTALTYHIIFGTHKRAPTIFQEHEHELYSFIFNFLKARDVYVRRIGGMPDHVHILCDIPPKYAISEIVKLLKSESSKFMRVNRNFTHWFGWSRRYGCFAVDASLRETRRQYIVNQKVHHSRVSFVDEYISLLRENGIIDYLSLLGDD